MQKVLDCSYGHFWHIFEFLLLIMKGLSRSSDNNIELDLLGFNLGKKQIFQLYLIRMFIVFKPSTII